MSTIDPNPKGLFRTQGNTVADAVLTDNAIVTGSGGDRGIDTASGVTLDSNGTLGGKTIGHGIQTLSDAATIVWAATSNIATVTIAGDRTLGAPTGTTIGDVLILYIIQGSGGSRLITWNAAYKHPTNGTAPTLSTGVGDVDIFTVIHRAASTFDVSAGSLDHA
jgi:hypothetical protein